MTWKYNVNRIFQAEIWSIGVDIGFRAPIALGRFHRTDGGMSQSRRNPGKEADQ